MKNEVNEKQQLHNYDIIIHNIYIHIYIYIYILNTQKYVYANIVHYYYVIIV